MDHDAPVAVRNAVEALAEAKRCADAGRIVYSRHALLRMTQRRVQAADVKCALACAHGCKAGDTAEKWVITGADVDGDDLTVVVVFELGALIVTVF